MIEGPPPLTEEWLPQPYQGATSQGDALVQLIASERLSWDDLWRIRATADWRVVRARRDAELVEREIAGLRSALAGMKRQKHEVEQQLGRLKEEASAMRAALGSEEKP